MRSTTSPAIRQALRGLPAAVQRQSRAAYRRFEANPTHPSLRLKLVREDPAVVSVRIARNYRALGVRSGDVIHWFWIGSHADYDKHLP